MEVLKKSHFILQIGNCPIPVAEHSVHWLFGQSMRNQDALAPLAWVLGNPSLLKEKTEIRPLFNGKCAGI